MLIGGHVCQVIVFMFGRSDTEHLLDLLEDGLFHQNARIRDSSVHLIGDLLHGLSGAGGSFVQALDDELTEEAEQGQYYQFHDKHCLQI